MRISEYATDRKIGLSDTPAGIERGLGETRTPAGRRIGGQPSWKEERYCTVCGFNMVGRR